MSRELLHRALDALEMHRQSFYPEGPELIAEIKAELKKPEPVECGQVEVIHGYPFGLRNKIQILSDGKYKLLAVRVDD